VRAFALLCGFRTSAFVAFGAFVSVAFRHDIVFFPRAVFFSLSAKAGASPVDAHAVGVGRDAGAAPA
jgi:hypothetical protein